MCPDASDNLPNWELLITMTRDIFLYVTLSRCFCPPSRWWRPLLVEIFAALCVHCLSMMLHTRYNVSHVAHCRVSPLLSCLQHLTQVVTSVTLLWQEITIFGFSARHIDTNRNHFRIKCFNSGLRLLCCQEPSIIFFCVLSFCFTQKAYIIMLSWQP